MTGLSQLDAMYADLALSTMTLAPVGMTEKLRAEIIARYDVLMRKEKEISRSRVDEYYGPPLLAELHGVKIPDSDAELKRPGTLTTDGKRYYCRVAHYPFSRGGVRAAYHGKLQREGTTEWKNVVLKEFIHPPDRSLSEYKNQSENSAVAKYIMEKYNRHNTPRKSLRIVSSRVLKMENLDGSEVVYNVEELLSGIFKKWTNNGGAILEKNNDLLGFTLWSSFRSKGYLLVSDLQGVESDVCITLTDPAVLCKDKSRFGPTNYDDAQMTLCLEAAKNLVGISRKDGPNENFTLRKGFSLYQHPQAVPVLQDAPSRKEFPNGDVYTGKFKEAFPHGSGVKVFANGAVYEGTYELGKEHGQGKFISVSGNIYDGQWRDGRENGQGKKTFSNGDIYEGDWVNGRIHGTGKMTYANGDVYKGSWKDDLYDGYGKFTHSNGDFYKGFWKEAKKNGVGKGRDAISGRYKGEYKDDRAHGKGRLIGNDGNVYEGEFKNGILMYGNRRGGKINCCIM
jgi:hypothetical protein